MTDLARGARGRRGGRRPGWVLLTALLVLAIGASSALVFTNRGELLKLAVILALWAGVAGAFVSVLYRRQSDADQARVRDLKLVYDLQLDREISARRDDELTVESHPRRRDRDHRRRRGAAVAAPAAAGARAGQRCLPGAAGIRRGRGVRPAAAPARAAVRAAPPAAARATRTAGPARATAATADARLA